MSLALVVPAKSTKSATGDSMKFTAHFYLGFKITFKAHSYGEALAIAESKAEAKGTAVKAIY